MKSWVLAITVMVAILIAVIVRIKNWVQGEWFRKLLHFVCLIILGVWVWSHETWWESVIGMLLGNAVCYVFGTAWFMFVASSKPGLAAALSLCVVPYILPDLCKIALAQVLTMILRDRLRAEHLL